MSNKVTAPSFSEKLFRLDSAIHMTAEALREIGTPLSEQQLQHILRHLAGVVAPVIKNKDKEIVNKAMGELAEILDTYALTVSRR